jgi:hypothetical protein
MKLPAELAREGVEGAVLAALEKDTVRLCGDLDVCVPILKLTKALRTSLFYSKALNEVIIGYEAIERSLANELHGLQKSGNQGDRVSRLLLVTRDGSPRFYRDVAHLQKKQGGRMLTCRLETDALLMGSVLGFAGHVVKAVLLNRKRSVIAVLKSLLPESGS